MSSPQVSLDAFHAADLGGAPVLDAATFGALAELAGDDDPDLIRDLVELFVEDSTERMGSMASGFDGGDVNAIGAAAHALKSSGANIGALEFSKSCAELERYARGGDVDQAQLESILSRTRRLYEEVITALSGSDA